VRISQDLLDELIEHARREAPNECCGVIVVRDGVAQSVQPAENIHASPLKFEIGHADQIRLYREFGDFDCIYHSHTRTEPYPSPTDINFAANWPGVEWLIVGLAGDEAKVRSFFIEDAVVREVPVEVT
jgi:[CysO sulfur-carrier protein]-S-L-cysteine hydrolase